MGKGRKRKRIKRKRGDRVKEENRGKGKGGKWEEANRGEGRNGEKEKRGKGKMGNRKSGQRRKNGIGRKEKGRKIAAIFTFSVFIFCSLLTLPLLISLSGDGVFPSCPSGNETTTVLWKFVLDFKSSRVVKSRS